MFTAGVTSASEMLYVVCTLLREAEVSVATRLAVGRDVLFMTGAVDAKSAFGDPSPASWVGGKPINAATLLVPSDQCACAMMTSAESLPYWAGGSGVER